MLHIILYRSRPVNYDVENEVKTGVVNSRRIKVKKFGGTGLWFEK